MESETLIHEMAKLSKKTWKHHQDASESREFCWVLYKCSVMKSMTTFMFHTVAGGKLSSTWRMTSLWRQTVHSVVNLADSSCQITESCPANVYLGVPVIPLLGVMWVSSFSKCFLAFFIFSWVTAEAVKKINSWVIFLKIKLRK